MNDRPRMDMKLFKGFNLGLGLAVLLILTSCIKDKTRGDYLTENCVVIVVDGPRYSETWGDSTHQYIPHLAHDLAKEGVIFTNFRNNGPTYTSAGHTALLTGNYQEINNSGSEKPIYPNYLNYWLKATQSPAYKAWIIASKDKIEILSDSQDSLWEGNFLPRVDCGNAGLGSGYRPDSVTVTHLLDSMETYHPNLVFVNFREPDYSGHLGDWDNYLAAIVAADKAYYQIWNYIQTSPHYKGKTSFFITNDHGRHLAEFGGFTSHGDNCEGCRHIHLFAAGPDFKKGVICETPFEQIDLTATIAELFHLEMPHVKGKVIEPVFR